MLRIIGKYEPSLAGRTVAILTTDGADASLVASLTAAVRAEGACIKIIAPKIGGVTLSDGERANVDGHLAGSPSALFDAVALILSVKGCAALLAEAAAVDFVRDASGHLKAIGFTPEAADLLQTAAIAIDDSVVDISESLAGFITTARTRNWAREACVRTTA